MAGSSTALYVRHWRPDNDPSQYDRGTAHGCPGISYSKRFSATRGSVLGLDFCTLVDALPKFLG